MTLPRESLFDGASYKLAALRSAEERHAIAQLDVAIEKIGTDVPPHSLIAEFVQAREDVLDRMVNLCRLLELRDEANDDALALVTAVKRVIA